MSMISSRRNSTNATSTSSSTNSNTSNSKPGCTSRGNGNASVCGNCENKAVAAAVQAMEQNGRSKKEIQNHIHLLKVFMQRSDNGLHAIRKPQSQQLKREMAQLALTFLRTLQI
eukprot:2730733-Rhodomonas_salina.1